MAKSRSACEIIPGHTDLSLRYCALCFSVMNSDELILV